MGAASLTDPKPGRMHVDAVGVFGGWSVELEAALTSKEAAGTEIPVEYSERPSATTTMVTANILGRDCCCCCCCCSYGGESAPPDKRTDVECRREEPHGAKMVAALMRRVEPDGYGAPWNCQPIQT